MSALLMIVLIRLCIAAFAVLFVGVGIAEFTRAYRAEPRLADLRQTAADSIRAVREAAQRPNRAIIAPPAMAALPPR